MKFKNICAVLILISIFCSSCTTSESKKNTITVAVEGKPYSLNPYIAKEQNSLEIRDLLFLSFFDWDENWNIFPRLAENANDKDFFYKDSNGEYILNTKISPNIRWSNGVFVHTGDVTFSCIAIAHPTIEKLNELWFSDMGKIESSNPYSFNLKLSRSDLSFIQDFRPIPIYALKDSMFSDSNSFFKNPIKIALVSNASYKIDKVKLKNKHISNVKFIKNQEYESKTNIEEIDLDYYSNISDKKFEKFYKKYDFLPSLTKNRADIIRKDNNYNVLSCEGTKLFAVFFNMKGITSDVLVRNAIYKQIDRGKITETYLNEKGDFAKSFFNQKRKDFLPLFNYNYSSEEAINSIVEAGMSINNGKIMVSNKQVSIKIATTKTSLKVAELVEQDLKKAGFDTTLNIYNSLSYYDITNLKEKPDIFVISIESNLFTEPGSIFSSNLGNIYSKKPYSNMYHSNWKDDYNTRLCINYINTADISQRKSISEEHQKIVFENLPAIPLFFDHKYCATNKKISGIKPRGYGSDMWNIDTWKVNN